MTTEQQQQKARVVGWRAIPKECANPECDANPSIKDAEPPDAVGQIWDNEYRCPVCKHGLQLVVPFVGNDFWRLRTLAPIEFPDRPEHRHRLPSGHEYDHQHAGGDDDHAHGEGKRVNSRVA